jgi:DNA-binding MarR family transcriptional regulator
MAGRIQAELRQSKPIASLEEEAFLNIVRTADVINLALEDTLEPYGISATQYNVLRILRGAGSAGTCCREIGERMITRDPDVTRLVDRLEKRKLVSRNRAKEDRRYITVRLTAAGLQMVNELDPLINQMHRKLVGILEKRQLETTIEVLEQIRSVLE